MPNSRCKTCSNCISMENELSKVKTKAAREKKRKKLSKQFPCSKEEAKKKSRISEAEALNANSCGGEYVRDKPQDAAFAAMNTPSAAFRRPLPADGAMALPSCDVMSHHEYVQVVANCRKIGEATTNEDVFSEFPYIMDKLEELLDKDQDKDEIDWKEALEDATHVAGSWALSAPVGDNAFSLSVDYRDSLISEMNKMLSDMQELDQIKGVWHEEFGDDAKDCLYEILYHIPDHVSTSYVIDFMKCTFCMLTETNEDISHITILDWIDKYQAGKDSTPDDGQDQEASHARPDVSSQWKNIFDTRKRKAADNRARGHGGKSHTGTTAKRMSRIQMLGQSVREAFHDAGVLRYNRQVKRADSVAQNAKEASKIMADATRRIEKDSQEGHGRPHTEIWSIVVIIL